eukprot:5616665-Pyramimonas_sp.AAC.1
MDPILRCLRAAAQLPRARHHKGSLGGCADDVGMVMPRLRDLAPKGRMCPGPAVDRVHGSGPGQGPRRAA